VIGEPGSLGGEAIHVGGLEPGLSRGTVVLPENADISIAQIIDKNEKDVGAL
jgi:hypothetical protein